MRYLFVFLALCWSCNTPKPIIQDNSLKNPYKTPQPYQMVAKDSIDVVYKSEHWDFDTLLASGKRKMIVSRQQDQLKGTYKFKYTAVNTDNAGMLLSIYSNVELKDSVGIFFYKATNSKVVNCEVNKMPCWCFFE